MTKRKGTGHMAKRKSTVASVTLGLARVLDAESAIKLVLDEMPYDRLEKRRGPRAEQLAKDLEATRGALIAALGLLRGVKRAA